MSQPESAQSAMRDFDDLLKCLRAPHTAYSKIGELRAVMNDAADAIEALAKSALSQSAPMNAAACQHPDCHGLNRPAVGKSEGIGFVCDQHGLLAMASKGHYEPLRTPSSTEEIASEQDAMRFFDRETDEVGWREAIRKLYRIVKAQSAASAIRPKQEPSEDVGGVVNIWDMDYK